MLSLPLLSLPLLSLPLELLLLLLLLLSLSNTMFSADCRSVTHTASNSSLSLNCGESLNDTTSSTSVPGSMVRSLSVNASVPENDARIKFLICEH